MSFKSPIYDYVKLLAAPLLPTQPWPHYKPKGLKGLTTSHPSYREELATAVKLLNDYFKNATKNSPPLNCLILGPPGAGKTFLAKQLAKSVDKPFEEHNVSLSSDPKSMLDELSKHAGGPKFVFIDEFDVTIAGSSVVRFLLDPITSEKHHQTVFVFSGSYLKNKPILERLNSNLIDFDFPLFLFHLLARQDDPEIRGHLLQLYQVCCMYQENRQASSPNADLIQYLSQLHKLRDFLSRINGFIIQIPDLASPMMITECPLILEGETQSNPAKNDTFAIRLLESKTAEYVHQFVKDMEKSKQGENGKFSFCISTQNSAILEFKQMLLTERLGFVMFMLKDYIEKTSKGLGETYFIRRKDLNFLVMAPLQHNIRSLKFLIERCTKINKPEDFKDIEDNHILWSDEIYKNLRGTPYFLEIDTASDIFSLHIAKEPFFNDPGRLWAFLHTANPEKFGNSQSSGTALRGEDFICLTQLKKIVTVLLLPFSGDSGDEEQNNKLRETYEILRKQSPQNELDEKIFHGIQVIPIEISLPSVNEQTDGVPSILEERIEISSIQDDPTSLIGKILGEYTLVLRAGEILKKNFLVETIATLENALKKNPKKPPSFVITQWDCETALREVMETVPRKDNDGKIIPDSFEDIPISTNRDRDKKFLGNHYQTSGPVLCRSSALKELLLVHSSVKWPFIDSAHFLQYSETRDKTEILNKKLFTPCAEGLTLGLRSSRIVKVKNQDS